MPGFGATKAKLIIQIGFKHTLSEEGDGGEESNSFPAECRQIDVDTNPEGSSFLFLGVLHPKIKVHLFTVFNLMSFRIFLTYFLL